MATRKGSKKPRTAKRPVRKTKSSRTVAKPAARRKLIARVQPETLRLRSFTPGLTVGDLQRSIDFYTRALGFVLGERWEEGGVLMGVMLTAGSCELGLSQDDWAKGRDRKKGVGVRLWCRTTQDLDALAARIRAAGGAADGPKTESWGDRTVAVDDPDGYHFTFTNYKA